MRSMFGFKKPLSSGAISLVSVSLGTDTVEIPVAEIVGTTPGKTILVTGGMDGDEYASIEAAYALIKKYASRQFAGTLICIPIINMPGFEAETSYNPLDQKHPKHISSLRPDGSPTERLMSWLVDTYVRRADVWIDLHGGALTEYVSPFLWIKTTGNVPLDARAQKIIKNADAELVVETPCVKKSLAGIAATYNCAYILAESGYGGERNKADIRRLVGWVESGMRTLELLPHDRIQNSNKAPTTIYKKVAYVQAPHPGIFRPQTSQLMVIKREILGAYTNYKNATYHILLAPQSGRILYRKQTMAMRKGDTLCAIAYK